MSSRSRIKITEIKTIRFRLVQKVGEIEMAWNPGVGRAFTIGGGSCVEIHTDQGLVGIGPAVSERYLSTIRQRLVGEDPFDLERHANVLEYYVKGDFYQNEAGIDIALWDLVGKATGQPLYKLWGGGKDKVIPYASLMKLSTPEERADTAVSLMEEGWRAIKLRLHYQTMEEDIHLVETVRQAVGDKMVIMADANQAQSSGGWQPGVRWSLPRAIETARKLKELGCCWLEDPLPRHAYDQLKELNRSVEIPIGGGENTSAIHEFLRMCQEGVYDLLQPESMVLGSITAMRKIGVLAELYGKLAVPHHGGLHLGLIAHLHLAASWPHAPYFEVLHEPPVGDYCHSLSTIAGHPKVDREGLLPVPCKPGLGVEINRDMIESEY